MRRLVRLYLTALLCLVSPHAILVSQPVRVGKTVTIAGTGAAGYSNDGSAATAAALNYPTGVARALNGDLYIADSRNNVIRKVSAASGIISTFAGNGTSGYRSGDDNQLATNAELDYPRNVALDAANQYLYIADCYNYRVRRVNLSTGIISTTGGNGSPAYVAGSENGSAVTGMQPSALTFDLLGNLLMTEEFNNRIRSISPAGIIHTIAGTGTGRYEASQDSGPATSAMIQGPQAIVTDNLGEIFFADAKNHRIRKIANGTITTVAGNGSQSYSYVDEGAQANAVGMGPTGVAVDPLGRTLFMADRSNTRVRQVDLGTGIITTVAGGYYQASPS